MRVTWAIAAALLVSAPILALPSPTADPAPQARDHAADIGEVDPGYAARD